MECEKCGSELAFDSTYDALYCPNCNEWESTTCDDPECEFCRDRPETPE